MEFTATNSLDPLLPEPGAKTGITGRPAAADERFAHHLQEAETRSTTEDPPSVADTPPAPTSATDSQPDDSSRREDSSSDTSTGQSPAAESSPPESAETDHPRPKQEADEREADDEPQVTIPVAATRGVAPSAAVVAPETSVQESPQETAGNSAGSVPAASQPLPSAPAEVTADAALPTPNPKAPEAFTPESPNPDAERRDHDPPAQLRGEPKTSGRARAAEKSPPPAARNAPDDKPGAPATNGVQPAKLEQWIELPETASKDTPPSSSSPDGRAQPTTTSLNVEGRADSMPGRVREGLAPQTADGTRETVELNRAQQARLVQRVGRAIEAAQQRGGPMRLRLSPPELGSLRLEVTVEKNVLSAKIEAESQMARAVLLENLPHLRDRLSEQGVQIEHFEVYVNDRSPDHTQQQAFDRQPDAELPSRKAMAEAHAADDQTNPPPPSLHLSKGTLNVVI